MNAQQIITDVVILGFGVFSALIAIYYVLKNDIQRFFNLKTIELNKESIAHILPLRLQEHER